MQRPTFQIGAASESQPGSPPIVTAVSAQFKGRRIVYYLVFLVEKIGIVLN
jgi:hypothetical protein